MKVVYELIDAELDAVCGGLFDFTNLSNNIVAQANSATQVGVARAATAFSVPVVRLASRSCSPSRTPARSAKSRMPAHP